MGEMKENEKIRIYAVNLINDNARTYKQNEMRYSQYRSGW